MGAKGDIYTYVMTYFINGKRNIFEFQATESGCDGVVEKKKDSIIASLSKKSNNSFKIISVEIKP